MKIENCKLQTDEQATQPRQVRRRSSIGILHFAFCILQCLLLSLPALAEESVPAAAPPTDKAATSETTSATKPPEPPPPPIPMELQPYRIRISVAFDEHPSLTAQVRQTVLDELSVWTARTYGQMWIASIEENHWLSPQNDQSLSRLTWPEVAAQVADKDLDKAIVLTVAGQGGVFRLCGREWDRMTQQISPRHERIVADRRALTNELGILIRDLFRPLLLIESVEAGVARVRARAGEFPPDDPSVEQLAKGNYFQPVLRFFNKDREVTQVQMIPWSYLLAESSDRAHGECLLQTGLRVPLGKNSKRVESWAIGVRPSFHESRVRLTPHNNPTKPLIGYQVNIYERLMVPAPPEAPAAKPAAAGKNADAVANEEEPKKPAGPKFVAQFNKVSENITDRRGRVTVPLNPERPLIWLYVSSGGNLLGRFPFMPGVTPTTTAELPDDSLRLQIESRLELLRAELIDSIAQRALLIARAKGAAKAADWPRFNETLAEFDRQSAAKYFQTLLDAIKAATLKQVQTKKDKALEKKIDKLCKDSAELIARHLGDERIKEQRDELVELKKANAEATANEGRQQIPARRAVPAPVPRPSPAPAPAADKPKAPAF